MVGFKHTQELNSLKTQSLLLTQCYPQTTLDVVLSASVNYQLIPQQRPYEFNDHKWAQMEPKEWNKYLPGWTWKYLDFDRSCSKIFSTLITLHIVQSSKYHTQMLDVQGDSA